MAINKMLSYAVPRNEHKPHESKATLSKNVNRLISAAVVSPRFRHLLLSDPIAALAAGYNGETFQLSPAEYAAVTSLRVSDVRDLAAQLLNQLEFATDDALYASAAADTYTFGEIAGTKTNGTPGDTFPIEEYRGTIPAQRYGL